MELRKGYLESRRVASLSPLAERFYFHLLLAADAKGRIEKNSTLLKNKCFPALDDIATKDVCAWVMECISADLLADVQDAEGKKLLQVLRYNAPKDKSHAGIPEADSCYPFEAFWSDYGKKTERRKCESKYAKLSEHEREKIRKTLPKYIAATPDVTYRKHPSTWLNNQCWEDEVFLPEQNANPIRKKGF